MHPVLFHLGPFPVFSFGVMVASGVFLSIGLMSLQAKKSGFPPADIIFDMVATSLISGFLGARVYYVAQNLGWYIKHPLKIFAFWEGGLIFYGGMAGAFLGFWVFLRLKKIPLFNGLDFILPYVALTHAFGRIGCFLNGCCYGKVCELPWAVQFPGQPLPVHPTQLYEAGLNLILFLFLKDRYSKKSFEGEVAAFYFAGYALIRFSIEFVRADNPALGLITINQWISLAVFAGAAAFLFFRLKSIQKK